MLPYTTQEEFNQRVVNTVIMLDGVPIYVHSCSERCRLSYFKLPLSEHPKSEYVAGDNPLLDAHNFKLGYCNVFGGFRARDIAYVSRMPVRQAHQGLAQGNVFFPPGSGINYENAIRQQQFVNMLTNRYPSFAEAKVMVKGPDIAPVRQVAFDRRWSISYEDLEFFVLHYKGKSVATSHGGEEFHLPRLSQYLRQVVEAKGIKVA